MMLGGVGFQAGVDQARAEQLAAARRQAAMSDVVEQLKGLQALRDDGALSQEEFVTAKHRVMGG